MAVRSKSSVAISLEQIALNIAKAVNTKDFKSTSPAWANVADDFNAEPAFSEWPRRTTSLEQFFDNFKAHFLRYPQYHVHVADLCTSVDEKRGRAEVFATLEVTGIPEGVMRPSVGTLMFRRVQGRWMCLQFVAVPGYPIAISQ